MPAIATSLRRPLAAATASVSGISARRRMASSGVAAGAFQLRLNPLTGDSEWVVVAAEEDGDGNGVADEATWSRSLLAATSYLDMLNDAARNRAYRRAIEATISEPCHVLDIGAGTGLLSMMAARAMTTIGGRDGGKVSACESYLPMGKLMRRVLQANGMEKQVKVFHKRSDELQVGVELGSPADVMVSEILDSELLGEGLIPTLQQAHDMLLVKNPSTVPYRATTYGQLVESTFLWKLNDLHSSEASAADGLQLTPIGMETLVSVKKQQYAMHCDALADEMQLLSEPFKIFEFEFWKRPESHHETKIQIRATDDGKVHAIVSWWVLQLDSAGSIFYSTAPRWMKPLNSQTLPADNTGKDWCDHWKQCVWFVQGRGVPVIKDQYVSLRASRCEISISYQLNSEGETRDRSLENNPLMLLPERIALYGDKDWRMALTGVIRNALSMRSSPSCVVADDSVFLTVSIASLSNSSNVIAIFPGLRDSGARYIQAVAGANSFSMDRIKVIGKRTTSSTADDLKQKKIDLLVGEPFYYGNEGMLPWQNLRFWNERTLLDSILAEDAFIMPGKGILKFCAMSLPDLWRSRQCLEDVEGFDHSVVNETLGACGNLSEGQQGPCLPYHVWQCGHVEKLSQVYSIMEFDFTEPIHACFGKRKMEFSNPGLCHGFALWIDWVIDEKNSVVLSTGPDSRYWKQGVQLLSKPVEVSLPNSNAEIEASFDPSTGELAFKSSFSSS